MYRHALPPGFILKKDKKDMEEQKETITIEELVERDVRLYVLVYVRMCGGMWLVNCASCMACIVDKM